MWSNYQVFNQKAFHVDKQMNSVINDDSEYAYYRITDNYINDAEMQLKQNPSRLIMLQNFYYLLTQTTDFDFYDVTYQPMHLKYSKGLEVFDLQYEAGMYDDSEGLVSVNGFTLKNNFLIQNNILTLNQMNTFPDYAFVGQLPIEKNCIPVFMGCDFSNFYQVGDILDVYYFGREFKIEILDFLQKNQYIAINDELVSLDKYIIAPSQDFNQLPTDAASDSHLFIYYLEKNNGYVYTQLSHNEVQSVLNKFGQETGVDRYVVMGATNSSLKNFALTLEQLVLLSTILTTVLIAFTLVTIVVTICVRIRDQQYVYAIHILCGCSIRTIKMQVLNEIITLLVASILISSAIYFAYGTLTNLGWAIIAVVSLLSCFTIFITSAREIKKINISMYARRKK